MSRWFSEDPEFTQISLEDKIKRDRLIEIISRYTTEMEGYSYFGSNPGIKEDDYEDIADVIMKEFDI